MDGENTIRYLADAFKVVGPVGQGLVDQQTANYNAGVLTSQARYAHQSAAYDEARIRRTGAQQIAEQVASAGGSGITLEGSPTDVIRQNARNIEMDALAARYRGDIDAAGFQSKAKMAKYEGNQALYGGVTSAGQKLLEAYRPRSKPYVTV